MPFRGMPVSCWIGSALDASVPLCGKTTTSWVWRFAGTCLVKEEGGFDPAMGMPGGRSAVAARIRAQRERLEERAGTVRPASERISVTGKT